MLGALSVKVIISPSIFIIYHPNHGWMMIYHHSRLHFRQSYFLNHEREEQQEGQESHCYQNKICFMSSSFCQNVIIYIIVYANHSLPPEIDKVLSWLVFLLAEEGHIMDKRTEKNGVHFCDVTIPPGHLFSMFLSVIRICQDWTVLSSELQSAHWFGLEENQIFHNLIWHLRKQMKSFSYHILPPVCNISDK